MTEGTEEARGRALQSRAAASFQHSRRLARVMTGGGAGGEKERQGEEVGGPGLHREKEGEEEEEGTPSPTGLGCLTAEDDDGDVEYKWRLTNTTPTRFEHLLTQMRFRVTEGNGQCLYEIGITNDGAPRGLPFSDFQESLETVQSMARALGLDSTILQEFMVQKTPIPLWCGEIIVTRRQAKTQDARVAFCGDTGSGKSTLIGVLLSGNFDNGAGSARQMLFNHKHEINTGKTTSIVTRTLPISNTTIEKISCFSNLNSNEISSRLITMIDLGGDVTKQMLFGLMSRRPEFIGICVSVDKSPENVVRYAKVCRALRFPLFVIVTKLDMVIDFEVDSFLLELGVQLSNIGCNSVILGNSDDVTKFQRLWETSKQVPVICVSSSDGTGINLFRQFLFSIPFGEISLTPDKKFEVLLDGSFYLPNVGPIVHGHVSKGSIELGCQCSIGPDVRGIFYPIVIQGIHVDGSHVTRVQKGEDATFAISELPSSVDMSQKGKILISSSVNVSWEFEAHITVLSQCITPHLQPILYTGNLRQAVKILSPLPLELQIFNKESLIRFRFLYHPEVLKEGASIILQWNPEGIAVGEVTTVFAHSRVSFIN